LTSVPRRNAITGENNPISPSATTNFFNGTLNTAFFQSALTLTAAFSTYHSLTIRVTKQLTSERFGLGQIQGIYTWSHSIDNAEDPLVSQDPSGRTFPRDSSGFAGGFNKPERGNSGFDTRNRFVLNFVYEFPFKSSNKVLDAVISSFSMGSIIQVQDGNPYSIFGGLDTLGSATVARASFAAPGQGIQPSANLNPRLQTGPSVSLFRNPNIGEMGDVARNAFVGPGFANVDFQLTKRITIAERHTFALRADFFNLFNRVNFGQPVQTITNPLFGQSLTAGRGRTVQFVLRYNF
jgi:hypothetical protein